MIIFIIILIVVGIIVVYDINSTAKIRKKKEENIERRKKFVESLGKNTQIIVNNGNYVFFKNDEQQFFGLDESGETYSYSGLQSIFKTNNYISFIHNETGKHLYLGKDISGKDISVPLDLKSILKIYMAMMPIVKQNLYQELDKYGIESTHEYVVDETIWGCDINSKQFYCLSGCPFVFDFSGLRKVTVEDLRSNTLYDGSYIIHVFAKPKYWDEEEEFEIHIKSPDKTYFNLLAMFKGIRNRQ